VTFAPDGTMRSSNGSRANRKVRAAADRRLAAKRREVVRFMVDLGVEPGGRQFRRYGKGNLRPKD
jgi:hypothetical protein